MRASFYFTTYALSLVLLSLAMISTHCGGAPPPPHTAQNHRKAFRVINLTGRYVTAIKAATTDSMTNHTILPGEEELFISSAEGRNRHYYLDIVWTTRLKVIRHKLYEAFNDTLAAERCILGEHGNTCYWYLYSSGIYLGKKSQGGWLGSSTIEWMHTWS